MAAARLALYATPSRALSCCSWSSRNLSCFKASAARVPVRLAAVPASISSEEDSRQLEEAAPSPNKKYRHSPMVELGIWTSLDSSCHVATFEAIEKDIDKLECVLMQSEEEIYRDDLSSSAVWGTQSELITLKAELCHLQTLLDLRDDSLNISLLEATKLKTLLHEAEVHIASLSLYKEASESRQAEELLSLEKSSCESLEIFDKYLLANEAMNNVQEKVQGVWESIVNSRCSSIYPKLIEILQSEASLLFGALLITTKSLERSEAEVSSLREKVISTEELLEKERRSLRAARNGLDKLEQALGNEESKVDDLFKEVSSLKAQLEQKEKIVLRLTDEAIKNKGLEEIASRHLDALHQSEKKVEQLGLKCRNLENQIRSRDVLLDEIKSEAFKSTEALKLAAQIKQDLNHLKQREVELTQDLEKERSQVKDLSRELTENTRAVRAELELRQAEKDMMDLTRELALLKRGIQSRDEVIKLMEEKIEGNIHILKCAADDREAIKKMQLHIQSLESKLREFI